MKTHYRIDAYTEYGPMRGLSPRGIAKDDPSASSSAEISTWDDACLWAERLVKAHKEYPNWFGFKDLKVVVITRVTEFPVHTEYPVHSYEKKDIRVEKDSEQDVSNQLVEQIVKTANRHVEFAKCDESNGCAMTAEKEWGFSRGIWYALISLGYKVEIDAETKLLKFTPVA